jgi:hypothetical protein
MTQEKLPSLIIGKPVSNQEIQHIEWSAVPDSLPPLLGFRSLLVIPSPDSHDKQEQLVDCLLRSVDHFGPDAIKVIWILNEHTVLSAVGRLGLGDVIPMQGTSSGRLFWWIPGIDIGPEEIVYGIIRGPWSVRPFATWRRSDGKVEIPVGVASGNKPWILAPPLPCPEIYLGAKWKFAPSLLSVGLMALSVLVIFAFLGLRHYNTQSERYQRGVAKVNAIGAVSRPLIAILRQKLDTKWSAPQERLALNLLTQPPAHWEFISPALRSPLRPDQLVSRDENEATALFDIAILSGDWPSTLRIVKVLNFEKFNRRELVNEATHTIWQAALESLHELDFPQAKQLTDLYLAISQKVLAGTTEAGDLEPQQRQRSLAYILQRELRSGRARALCRNPGIGNSFGRLLVKGGGLALPVEIADIELRRKQNAANYCGSLEQVEEIRYDVLSQLEVLNNTVGAVDVCRIAPVECEFADFRRSLSSGLIQSTIASGLNFAKKCSYLSDDTIAIILRKDSAEEDNSEEDSSDTHRYIDVKELDQALACAEKVESDYWGIIAKELAVAPCSWFHFPKTSENELRNRMMTPLIKRCESRL